MKIKIIGAGALGMMVAARLFLAGQKVELVTRSFEQAEEIDRLGLILTEKGPDGLDINQLLHIPAYTFEELGPRTESDRSPGIAVEPTYLWLMLKQTAITDLLAQQLAKQLTPPSTHLVCFQNGIGHIEVLRRYIPMEQIWSAVTTEGAFKSSPRHVKHTGKGTTWLGSHYGSSISQDDVHIGNILHNLLIDAGFSALMSNNINSKVWDKLLINAVINPLTAILQLRNGLLPDLPALLPLMRTLYEEGSMLAEQLGIQLSADLWEQIGIVCTRTADNESSMLQDIKAGRLTEIEAITGGLLREAQQIALPLPTHAALYYMIRSIEQQWEII
ncbi:ketopantoate reductase family protein [Paenibacillus agricola]|uniref:2-dehydropantoate 2-reductase n=1 Tax=Paenibacillus agricola TaxID=2716264 RepID=A0ABX0J7S4_9BACL|nr:2-dehydropantoate 2-reductase [Paenibacillus agricola]NHN30898.1 2-dehydropantoate 2-reductase [Paenibacillus agricola]